MCVCGDNSVLFTGRAKTYENPPPFCQKACFLDPMNFTVIVVGLDRLGYVTYKAYSSILSPGVTNERVDCLALLLTRLLVSDNSSSCCRVVAAFGGLPRRRITVFCNSTGSRTSGLAVVGKRVGRLEKRKAICSRTSLRAVQSSDHALWLCSRVPRALQQGHTDFVLSSQFRVSCEPAQWPHLASILQCLAMCPYEQHLKHCTRPHPV